ncbi:transporter substrate-binding domain-containing protein [Fundicoccus culcitae]|uniref:Transporter substrate-binding domain-containing protein n=1 Tax=Fundicoccus culcitae TaxID=2969821 RepID=A0ABY5P3M5_9LACT|nr:transporter substrate-binding domain-containing protein [Fundicoccus culcitae]UUX33063.1 transporter substrate-binding domain-containing protein [Fundicoccus culcitae]
MKKGLKFLFSSLLLLSAVMPTFQATTVSAQEELPAQVQALRDAGVIRVGIKEDVPYFGFLNPDTNEHEGFEIDLARLLAEEITGSPDNVEFTGVTAKTRGPLLDNGEVDMIIATFTITEERKETYNFSDAYFTDQVGFLVRSEDGYTDLASLNGKTIGVAQSATTKQKIEEIGAEDGLAFKFSELASYPELKTALTSRRIDAFSVDKSILAGYVDDNTEILEIGFAPQEYGVATALSNDELAAYINDLINQWLEDGTLEGLLAEHGLVDAAAEETEEDAE